MILRSKHTEEAFWSKSKEKHQWNRRTHTTKSPFPSLRPDKHTVRPRKLVDAQRYGIREPYTPAAAMPLASRKALRISLSVVFFGPIITSATFSGSKENSI